MPKVTFELTPELKRRMDAHPEINWSAVFRQAVERQAEAAEIAQGIVSDSSDARVKAVAQALKRGARRRWDEAARARGR